MVRGLRTILRRVLIGWWMVIIAWSFHWLLSYLLFGVKDANEMARDVTKAVWYGDIYDR